MLEMLLTNSIEFSNLNIEKIQDWSGKICLIITQNRKLSLTAKKLNRKMKGALHRSIESSQFQKLSNGEGLVLAFPVGLCASSIQLIRLERNVDPLIARVAGGEIANQGDRDETLLICEDHKKICDLLYGYTLKTYNFDEYKTQISEKKNKLLVMSKQDKQLRLDFKPYEAIAKGIYLTRNLINEPANVLNTIEFSERLKALKDIGIKVDILEEVDIEKLEMRALLAVGQGSECPSKVAILKWEGGGNDDPLLLVGKGVGFDTGGISIKPAGGMEERTMDMGGAGVVAGVMMAVALRKSKSNIIGLIGLVENMPDGKAQRPGDIVTSMKGDTIEVINTDAEGRLVLCDLLWYGQKYFSPRAIIDLATLTGAVVVSLGHENAGVFSNNDELCEKFLKSAEMEGEGAWRLPLSKSYEKLLKSRIADVANIGGRTAGAITAAKFLERFITNNTPWIHIDIAGVAFLKSSTTLGPRGATGWGVASLNNFISKYYEERN